MMYVAHPGKQLKDSWCGVCGKKHRSPATAARCVGKERADSSTWCVSALSTNRQGKVTGAEFVAYVSDLLSSTR